ncbi:MAG: ABC transporter ATP-binding protein [Bacteroidales bacterium]
MLGIVGESGSGKSVTALAILRLIEAPGKISGGEIFFNDNGRIKNLLKLDKRGIRKIRGNIISMIFQEPMTSLNPVYKCGPQVAEAILEHQQISKKQARQKVIELFRELQLPRSEKIYDNYPHELSGGQKQRVMIAMAMACEPDLLIADEPTTALDVTVQKSILAILKKLREKYNMGIIFISHDLGVIAEIADEVIVMKDGKIVEKASVNNIFNQPQHPYTKGLIACRPHLESNPERLPTVSDFLNNQEKSKTNFSAEKSSAKKTYQKQEEKPERKAILTVSQLKTHFEQKAALFQKAEVIKAVDNVSIHVFPGETLGLVGESGCGKTTLGRSILRLIEPSSGDIFFKGINFSKLSKKELRKARKNIQVIFQDPYSSLNPRITVGNAVKEPMKVFKLYAKEKERREKAEELLEKTGLTKSHYNRYPHELSGGQRQRVCIARALAVQPEFIICDESVSALDVSVQAQILNLLNDLKDVFGFSYIFISHDLSVVKYMSDRIAVMKDAKIVELNAADELYRYPETDYTRKLIDSIPRTN